MDYALGILGEKKLSRRRRGRTNRYSCQVESFNILEVFFLTFHATYSIKKHQRQSNKIKVLKQKGKYQTLRLSGPCTFKLHVLVCKVMVGLVG